MVKYKNKKLKAYLKIDSLKMLADFLERGLNLGACISLLEVYDPDSDFKQLHVLLKEGYEFVDALAFFSIDREWLDYFALIYGQDSLSQAIKGACQLLETKQRFLKILSKNLLYPFILVLIMLIFSLFSGQLILPQMQQLWHSFMMNEQHSLLWLFSLLEVMPRLIALLALVSLIILLWVIQAIQHRADQRLYHILQVPAVGNLLQYYYSIKFACYFGALCTYVSKIHTSIQFMYETLVDSDLMPVCYPLKQALDQGKSFEEAVTDLPFFHLSLKRFVLIVIESGAALNSLGEYAQNTTIFLEKKVQHYSRLLMYIIYAVTTFFIIGLYLIFLLPMIQIAGAL